MHPILVFDVNETLLDLRPLDFVFTEIFGDASARSAWFNLLLQRAFTATITGAYRDFGALGASALKMVAAARECTLEPAHIEQVASALKELPPHPDVPDALQTLCDAGFVLTALTQSPAKTLEAQLTHAGLRRFFTRVFSADAAGRYKPDPAPYRMVADAMRCSTADLLLVAAHAWDIEGAMRAGCRAAFVARSGHVLDPAVSPPEIVGADLGEVAVELLGEAGAVKA